MREMEALGVNQGFTMYQNSQVNCPSERANLSLDKFSPRMLSGSFDLLKYERDQLLEEIKSRKLDEDQRKLLEFLVGLENSDIMTLDHLLDVIALSDLQDCDPKSRLVKKEVKKVIMKLISSKEESSARVQQTTPPRSPADNQWPTASFEPIVSFAPKQRSGSLKPVAIEQLSVSSSLHSATTDHHRDSATIQHELASIQRSAFTRLKSAANCENSDSAAIEQRLNSLQQSTLTQIQSAPNDSAASDKQPNCAVRHPAAVDSSSGKYSLSSRSHASVCGPNKGKLATAHAIAPLIMPDTLYHDHYTNSISPGSYPGQLDSPVQQLSFDTAVHRYSSDRSSVPLPVQTSAQPTERHSPQFPLQAPYYSPRAIPIHQSVQAPSSSPNRLSYHHPVQCQVITPNRFPTQPRLQSPGRTSIQPPVQAPLQYPGRLSVQPPVQVPLQPPSRLSIQPPFQSSSRFSIQSPVRPPLPSPSRLSIYSPVQVAPQSPIEISVHPPVQTATQSPNRPTMPDALLSPVHPPKELPYQRMSFDPTVQRPPLQPLSPSIVSERSCYPGFSFIKDYLPNPPIPVTPTSVLNFPGIADQDYQGCAKNVPTEKNVSSKCERNIISASENLNSLSPHQRSVKGVPDGEGNITKESPATAILIPATDRLTKGVRSISIRPKEKSVCLEKSKAATFGTENPSPSDLTKFSLLPSSPSPSMPTFTSLSPKSELLIGEGEEESRLKSSAITGSKSSTLEISHQGQYKTELCKNWLEKNTCPYANHCRFAHGPGELRAVLRHPLYKTQACRMLMEGKDCKYGHRCHFRHDLMDEELEVSVIFDVEQSSSKDLRG